MTRDAEAIVDKVIARFGDYEPDPRPGNESLAFDPSGKPCAYLRRQRANYVRAARDIGQLTDGTARPRLLEIGAFYGILSIALAEAGADMVAVDLPEYMALPALKDRMVEAGVTPVGLRLNEFSLPFIDGEFDGIVICETLQYLNFNPLPLFAEFNRVLKTGGFLYVSGPNQASLQNRMAALRGKSLGVSVQSLFNQLDGTRRDMANGQWRTYTGDDMRDMLLPLGFDIGECRHVRSETAQGLKGVMTGMIYELFPAMKDKLITIARKTKAPVLTFTIPPTVALPR